MGQYDSWEYLSNFIKNQTLLSEIQESHLPISFSLRWEKRLSNEFMKRADLLCRS